MKTISGWLPESEVHQSLKWRTWS